MTRERVPYVVVNLEYRDQRDGAALSGWRCGPEISGEQVWRHSPSHNVMPPPSGWKIPWDAEIPATGALIVRNEYALKHIELHTGSMSFVPFFLIAPVDGGS